MRKSGGYYRKWICAFLLLSIMLSSYAWFAQAGYAIVKIILAWAGFEGIEILAARTGVRKKIDELAYGDLKADWKAGAVDVSKTEGRLNENLLDFGSGGESESTIFTLEDPDAMNNVDALDYSLRSDFRAFPPWYKTVCQDSANWPDFVARLSRIADHLTGAWDPSRGSVSNMDMAVEVLYLGSLCYNSRANSFSFTYLDNDFDPATIEAFERAVDSTDGFFDEGMVLGELAFMNLLIERGGYNA